MSFHIMFMGKKIECRISMGWWFISWSFSHNERTDKFVLTTPNFDLFRKKYKEHTGDSTYDLVCPRPEPSLFDFYTTTWYEDDKLFAKKLFVDILLIIESWGREHKDGAPLYAQEIRKNCIDAEIQTYPQAIEQFAAILMIYHIFRQPIDDDKHK